MKELKKKTNIYILLIILMTGLFSRYVFGDNNPLEELSEFILLLTTGIDINFSPAPENPYTDINMLLK
jgi:hypothetical protein